MSSNFDPYHKWLGISPKDQPPHHYRLLGLELFEDDPDVIDAAAARLMSYLHDVSTGEAADHAQRLLNEISAARLCLLNAEKKQQYDRKLKSKLQKQSAGRPTPPRPAAAATSSSPAAPPPAPVPSVEVEAAAAFGKLTEHDVPRRPVRNSRSLIVSFLMLAVALVVLAGVVMVLLNRDQNVASNDESDGQSQPSAREDAVLLITWPAEERSGAKVSINGFNRPLPVTGEIRWTINPGMNRLVIIRPGYRSIREQIVARAGERHQFEPVWVAQETPAPEEAVDRAVAAKRNGDDQEIDPLPDDLANTRIPATYFELPEKLDGAKLQYHKVAEIVEPPDQVQLRLLGGDMAAGPEAQFVVTSNTDENGNKLWWVRLKKGEQTPPIAFFGLVSKQLDFGWHVDDVDVECMLLRNCVIEIQVADQTGFFQLRAPQRVEMLPFVDKNGLTRSSIEIEGGPKGGPQGDQPRLQILGVKGSPIIRRSFKSKLLAPDTHRIRLSAPEELPIVAEIEYSYDLSTDLATMDTRLLYRNREDDALIFFVRDTAERERNQIRQDLQMAKDRRGRNRNKKQQQDLDKRISNLEMWAQYYDGLLDATDKDRDVGLRFRIMMPLGDRALDLVTTEG